MSQKQIAKALEALIKFQRSRKKAGLWGKNEGCQVIDETINRFGVVLYRESRLA